MPMGLGGEGVSLGRLVVGDSHSWNSASLFNSSDRMFAFVNGVNSMSALRCSTIGTLLDNVASW